MLLFGWGFIDKLSHSGVRFYGNCIQEYIEHFRSLYKQLVEEVPSEKFDERRVNLLKAQVIQLERQVRDFVTLKFKVISSMMVLYYSVINQYNH